MFPYSGGPRAQIFRSEDIQKGQFDRALIRIFIKKNRKRGLAPGFVGFSKLSTAKGKDRAGASVGQRRSILKRRENERDTRSKQFYNTPADAAILLRRAFCFLGKVRGALSLSLSRSLALPPPLSHFLFPLPSSTSALSLSAPLSLSRFFTYTGAQL